LKRINSQDLLLDIFVTYDITNASQTSQIKDTISYVDLAKLATHLAVTNKYLLLESFAVEFIDEVERQFASKGVHSCYIKIKKTQAVKSTKYVFVELERRFR
jgi:dihydroneopterin aldolase